MPAAANILALSPAEMSPNQKDVFQLSKNQYVIRQAFNASCFARLSASVSAMDSQTSLMDTVSLLRCC